MSAAHFEYPCAQVALPLPVDRLFTYDIPGPLREIVKPGARVVVPFGRRRLTGYVLAVDGDRPAGVALRPIAALVDEEPLLTPALLDLARWMSDWYVHPVGEVLRAVLPAALKGRGRPAPAVQAGFPEDAERPDLNHAQDVALSAVTQAVHEGGGRLLLYGVTGSGKTEVYLRCIEDVLAAGGSVIVLIPEIGLVPQATARFRRRFGDLVAVLHSRLSGPRRATIWRDAREGRVRVVIGARSAVFVPLRDLRLIVVDEEQDSSFKQQEKPHYNALEVAAERARREGAVLLSGSATPSLESWSAAASGEARLLELPERPGAGRMPPVEVIDMRGRRPGISDELLDALARAVSEGHQGIVLINRRGWANRVQCAKCGWTARCRNCSIALTWHARERRLLCHYCGWNEERPPVCPECGGVKFVQPGRGTQKAETELANLLPGARVLRMDLDTTTGVTGHERVLGAFARGEADILLGTQMVAKGHHYPNVTVVGIISADAGLNFPDFRAAERTYQLLSQAAGRTGRGEAGGAVYVQTYAPDHYLFPHLVGHDFPGFASRELRLRSELRYPPAGRLMLVTVSAASPERTREAGERAVEAMAGTGVVPGPDVLGPVPALIGRLRGRYRVQILVRGGPDTAGKRRLVEAARGAAAGFPGVDVQWDVDPLDIF